MKNILFVLLLLPPLTFAQKADYPIQVVPFTKVTFNDNFGLPRIKTNHMVTTSDPLNGVTVRKTDATTVVIEENGLKVSTVRRPFTAISILRLGTPWKRRDDALVS